MEQQSVKWVYGYMWKIGHQRKTWKRRIFMLKPDGKLRYYECFDNLSEINIKTLDDPLGVIDVRNAKVFEVDRNVFQRVKDSYIFGLTPKETSDRQARTYIMEADSAKKRKLWLTMIMTFNATLESPNEAPKAFGDDVLECWMEKMGEKESPTGWRTRYFSLIMNNEEEKAMGIVSYYKTSKDAMRNSPAGKINLTKDTVYKSHPQAVLGRTYVFSLTLLGGRGRRYLISAASAREHREWANRLMIICSHYEAQADSAASGKEEQGKGAVVSTVV